MDQQALGSKYWSLITGIRCLISIDIYRILDSIVVDASLDARFITPTRSI